MRWSRSTTRTSSSGRSRAGATSSASTTATSDTFEVDPGPHREARPAGPDEVTFCGSVRGVRRAPRCVALERAGAHAVLVGESLVTAPDPAAKLRSYLGSELAERTGRSGRFGEFGGRYVPEALMGALDELDARGRRRARTSSFQDELDGLLPDGRRPPDPSLRGRALLRARRAHACC